MKSDKHEDDKERLRYANLEGYSIITLSETGEVGLRDRAGRRQYTTIRRLEQEAVELVNDRKPLHEGKFSQRRLILSKAYSLRERFRKDPFL